MTLSQPASRIAALLRFDQQEAFFYYDRKDAVIIIASVLGTDAMRDEIMLGIQSEMHGSLGLN